MNKAICALILAFDFLLVGLLSPLAHAAEALVDKAGSATVNAESGRAQALLAKASAAYEANRSQALAAFSRVGDFIDGDLYVYVIGNAGEMLASGGPSVALVGRDVRNLKDSAGKPFIKEMLDGAARSGSGSVEYRWLNREHGKVERKIAYYRKVGDAIIAVGYYIPRAAAQEARTLLDRAVTAMKVDPKLAIERFNDMNGGFVEDDLYVFIVGIDNVMMYAHGAMPRLVGRNVDDLKDVDGKPIIQKMLSIVKLKGSGEFSYSWPNPVTRKVEHKTSYLQRVGSYMVAVGHYAP